MYYTFSVCFLFLLIYLIQNSFEKLTTDMLILLRIKVLAPGLSGLLCVQVKKLAQHSQR